MLDNVAGASTTQLASQEGTAALVKAAEAGFKQTRISTGEGVLQYYEFYLTPGLVIGVLAAFYVVFHVMSYFAMAHLYGAKR